MQSADASAFGVYVHIPFCRSKCHYCDFNSYAGRASLIPAYVAAVRAEMAAREPETAGGQARSLYFGGGTPSLLPPEDVGALVSDCRERWRLAPEAEISLEANPGTLTGAGLRALRTAGVNRLSLGVQSFADPVLRALGRRHTARDGTGAFALAREAGFENIGLDLIYGAPGQTPGLWEADLRRALDLDPEHVSTYGLGVEPNTPLARMVAEGRVQVPSADAAADLYGMADALLTEAGYLNYEISNWARRGRGGGPTAVCLHNLGYWRRRPYLGLGAGAHSYVGGERSHNHASPEEYIRLVAASGVAQVEGITLTDRESWWEEVMLGLRLREGIDVADLSFRYGLALQDTWGPALTAMGEIGLVSRSGRRVHLTLKGRLLANDVMARLLYDLQAV